MIRRQWMITAVGLVVCGAVAAAGQATHRLEYRPDILVQVGVSDLDRSIAFYRDTLGFTVSERRDDLKFAHIATRVPGLELGLDEVPNPKGSGTTVINLGVTNVGAARRALEAKGVAFRGETVVIPGKVALAGFADPDGNVLRLAGPPDTATSSQ